MSSPPTNLLFYQTDEVLSTLRDKHPTSPVDTRSVPAPSPETPHEISEMDLLHALQSFKPSSACGIDCLRPTHLKDLTGNSPQRQAERLRSSLKWLCNSFIEGFISPGVRDLFFASNLIAIRKKDGGVRPIAVGNRLSSSLGKGRIETRYQPDIVPTQTHSAWSRGTWRM